MGVSSRLRRLGATLRTILGLERVAIWLLAAACVGAVWWLTLR